MGSERIAAFNAGAPPMNAGCDDEDGR